jgi:hypothetical protein
MGMAVGVAVPIQVISVHAESYQSLAFFKPILIIEPKQPHRYSPTRTQPFNTTIFVQPKMVTPIVITRVK